MKKYSVEGKEKILAAAKANREKSHRDAIERHKAYEADAPKCLQCGKSKTWKQREGKFCSRSCSATYNNLRSGKVAERRFCPTCKKEIFHSQRKFCSMSCASQKRLLKIWLAGEMKDYQARSYFRKYAPDKKCAICGISEWQGKPLSLNVDHIDGNSDNNKPENFRFVCPNCDSQQPTYGSKNVGKGRLARRERRRSLRFI